jgi:hypothetical protein
MAIQSQTSKDLWLLEGQEDFSQYAVSLSQKAVKTIAILSRDLDAPIYAQADFVAALSQLARSGRNSQIQLLIKDTKSVLALGHPLARLAQRLPSKIMLRKLTQEPDNKDMGFMLCDTNLLLLKNDDASYRGFANFTALREVKQLRKQFDYCWQYAHEDPDLRQLSL